MDGRHRRKLGNFLRNWLNTVSYGGQNQVKALDFFSAHPVFTRDEFAQDLGRKRKEPNATVDSTLGRYLRSGRIGRVKRGVFFAAGPGETASRSPVDFLLVASRLAPDAVLAYHTALEAHGYAQSLYERLLFLTERKTKPVAFRGRAFVPVAPPAALRRQGRSFVFTTEVERRGLPCRVTSLERTVADALDRPDLTGGLEEAWRSLAAIPLLDLTQLLEYVRLSAAAIRLVPRTERSRKVRERTGCRAPARGERGRRRRGGGPGRSGWGRGGRGRRGSPWRARGHRGGRART